jgi:hypothetical protein
VASVPAAFLGWRLHLACDEIKPRKLRFKR